jgi:flagellar hook capping protein FlgD
MTRTRLSLTIVALTLWASLATGEPRLLLRYPQGVPQVSLTGDFARSSYVVQRAPAGGGAFEPLTQGSVLCMGECYALDHSAIPGTSYFYRFDLLLADGTAASYGPFLATISPALARPIGVFVYPNPSRGPATVQLHVAGGPAAGPALGEAALFDLAGRRVRVIHQGAIDRGLTTLTWDGRDDRGHALSPGVYLLRFAAEGRVALERLVRR